jgi:peroxiredoxin Q/BCP
MDQLLKVGDKLPDFEARDSEGNPITLEDLLGGPFVIYFYPRDDTPGCTDEACQFRDLMPHFEDLGVLVVGVSGDTSESHKKFLDKHGLNFPLISDESLSLSRKCGVTKTKTDGREGIVRSTFICDEDGVVHWLESPVKVEGHVTRVMAAMENALG